MNIEDNASEEKGKCFLIFFFNIFEYLTKHFFEFINLCLSLGIKNNELEIFEEENTCAIESNNDNLMSKESENNLDESENSNITNNNNKNGECT